MTCQKDIQTQTSKPVVVGVMSSIPIGGNFIFAEAFSKLDMIKLPMPRFFFFLNFGGHKSFSWGH